MRLASGTHPAGERPDVREVAPKSTFSLLGVTWSGRKPDVIDVRTKSTHGAWSTWRTLDAEDAGPDSAAPTTTSEPLWTGPATRIQARATRGGANVTDELSVVTIDPGTSTNDSKVRLSAAISGSTTMPTVITRAQWGADESLMTWPPEYASTVRAAAIHHTANSNDYTCDQSASLVRGIYYYHAVTNGWGDIGYNALVDKCGNIFEGRTGGLNMATIGAHTGGFNTYVFGISMIGDYTTVAPSDQLLDSVAQMISWKLTNNYDDPAGNVTLVSAGGGTDKYPAGQSVTLPTIFGHRDTGNTDCPGDFGYAALDTVRSRVAQLAGDWQSSPIYQKWQSLGGESSLGPAYSVETDWPGGGRATDFGNGASTIAWRSDLGAHVVSGAIHGAFVKNGGESVLGYPTTDEMGTADGVGRYNLFSNDGSIYWTPTTGAHVVYGAIQDKWSSLGSERSWLGYPTSDVYPVSSGFRSNFQGGYILWNTSTGAANAYVYWRHF